MSVVVVNWNGRHLLAESLPALAAQEGTDLEVIVVDNASSDGSAEWIRRAWPGVHLVEAPRNLGFAAANNVGIAAAESEWLALLNPDAVPGPEWLATMLDAAQAPPVPGIPRDRLAAVASCMVFADRPGIVNSTGVSVDAAGIAWDRLGGSPLAAAQSPAEVFGASAGAALYRRQALLDAADLDEAGRQEIFDASFFMYFEDVDLSWRLRLRGWRTVYVPEAIVPHVGSASAGEGSPFKNRFLARNKVWTLMKDFPAGPMARRLPLVIFYDLASAPYRLLAQGQSAGLLGRWDALKGARRPLGRRRRIQGRRNVSWGEVAAFMEGWTVPWKVPRRYGHLRAAEPGPAYPGAGS